MQHIRCGVVRLQDYDADIDRYLAEEEIYTEEGRFNEALLARPPNKPPPKGPPPDPSTPFVPVGTPQKTCSDHPRSSSRRTVDGLSLLAQEELLSLTATVVFLAINSAVQAGTKSV